MLLLLSCGGNLLALRVFEMTGEVDRGWVVIIIAAVVVV